MKGQMYGTLNKVYRVCSCLLFSTYVSSFRSNVFWRKGGKIWIISKGSIWIGIPFVCPFIVDVCSTMFDYLKVLYKDVVPTTQGFQNDHLATHQQIYKISTDYDKTQCDPQHVFYMATEEDMATLKRGCLLLPRGQDCSRQKSKGGPWVFSRVRSMHRSLRSLSKHVLPMQQ